MTGSNGLERVRELALRRTIRPARVMRVAVLAVLATGVAACSSSSEPPASSTGRVAPGDLSRTALQPASGGPAVPGDSTCKLTTANWKQASTDEIRVQVSLPAPARVTLDVSGGDDDAALGSASTQLRGGSHTLTVRVSRELTSADVVHLRATGASTLSCAIGRAAN